MPSKRKQRARLIISINGDEIKIVNSDLDKLQLYKMLLGALRKIPYCREAMEAALKDNIIDHE